MEEILLLSAYKKTVLDRYLLYQISTLRERTQNGLKEISATLNPDELYETIFQPHFDFMRIRNIGRTSAEEFEVFKIGLVSFIETLGGIGGVELNKLFVKLIISDTFKSLPENFDFQFELLFDENNRLKLFALLKFLVDNDLVFNKTEKKIFQLTYANQGDGNISMSSIAEEQEITEERVRQIKVEIEKNIQSHFLFIGKFPINGLVNYGLDAENPFYIMDGIIAQENNGSEGVNFNSAFYAVILGIFIKETHTLLGNNQVILGENKGQRRYKNCYLIKSDIVDNFHFTPFIKDIFLRKNTKIAKPYSLDLRGHMFQFFRSPESRRFLNDILPICKLLILNEVDLVVDQFDYIRFEKNTRNNLPSYCYEILEEISHPMTLTQISDAINRKYPNLEFSEPSLRKNLNSQKDVFINFSRTSTYGLLKWETEKDNILGGSIGDIAERYLKRAQNPKHISEIFKYVFKYRPETEIFSLRPNLMLEKGNRFTFFHENYVGLRSNSRRDRGFRMKKIVGTHFRLSVFEEMKGWHFSEIVRYFVREYGYDKVNVTYLIKKKIADGKLSFSAENNTLL